MRVFHPPLRGAARLRVLGAISTRFWRLSMIEEEMHEAVRMLIRDLTAPSSAHKLPRIKNDIGRLMSLYLEMEDRVVPSAST
jgi:hypothetical protein